MKEKFKIGDIFYIEVKVVGVDRKDTYDVCLDSGGRHAWFISDNLKIKKIKLKKNFTELEEGCYYRNESGDVRGPMYKSHGVFRDHLDWPYSATGEMNVEGESRNDLVEKVEFVRCK